MDGVADLCQPCRAPIISTRNRGWCFSASTHCRLAGRGESAFPPGDGERPVCRPLNPSGWQSYAGRLRETLGRLVTADREDRREVGAGHGLRGCGRQRDLREVARLEII